MEHLTNRETRYREQAAELREMAGRQPPGTLRETLLETPEMWDQLADCVVVDHPPAPHAAT